MYIYIYRERERYTYIHIYVVLADPVASVQGGGLEVDEADLRSGGPRSPGYR